MNVPGGGGSIPCTGANSGECIGLSEEQQAEGPQPVPESTVGNSPTVHGSIGFDGVGDRGRPGRLQFWHACEN